MCSCSCSCVYDFLCCVHDDDDGDGNIGSATDSPDTARALLSDRAIRWLTAAGATTYDSGNDFAEDGTAIRKECEISPLLSYSGEGLSDYNTKKVPLPCILQDLKVDELALDVCEISEIRKNLLQNKQDHISDAFPNMSTEDKIYKQVSNFELNIALSSNLQKKYFKY